METKDEYKTCVYCNGTGRIMRLMPMVIGRITTMMPQYLPCTYCCGKGKVKK